VSHDRPATGQAIRRFTLGSGPLKRTSDRLQVLARVLLTSVLLSAVAIALAVATASYTAARSEADAQAAERQQVNAELVEDAVVSHSAEGTPNMGRATASWTGPSGVVHTDVIKVAVVAKAGSTQAIWIDRNGDRTTRPLSDSDVSGRAVGIGLLTDLGISLAAVGAYLMFRRQLDRSRSRRWAAEWAVVEPTWSGNVP
jgi:hypothetical protein